MYSPLLVLIVFSAVTSAALYVWQLAAPKGEVPHFRRAFWILFFNIVLVAIFFCLSISGKISWSDRLFMHAVIGYGFAITLAFVAISGVMTTRNPDNLKRHRLFIRINALLFFLNIATGLYSLVERLIHR